MTVEADKDLDWCSYCDSREVGRYHQGSLRINRMILGGVFFFAFSW